MIINSSFDHQNSLLLKAYSHKIDEILAIDFVLLMAQVSLNKRLIPRDNRNRLGFEYIVKSSDIPKVENYLFIRFFNENGKVNLYVNIGNGGGRAFSCRRIDTPPYECQPFFAENEQQALVKCALIANSNNWLGGVPSPGQC